MTYNPRTSKGLRFFRGYGVDLTTTTWQIINGISDWAAPSPTVQSIDMTTIKDEATVYAPGIRESGNSSMTLYFDDLNPSHQKLLIDDSKSTTNIPYRIDFTDTGTSVVFMGHPTSVPVAGSVGSANAAAITFYVSGDPEWTFGSGDDPEPDDPSSVPEYIGATDTTAGVAGLVPPAAAGKQDRVLTGGGEWKYPKDVAIGGDQYDLASARGMFDSIYIGGVDCNTVTKQGTYDIDLTNTTNGPGFTAKLVVLNRPSSLYTNQIATSSGYANAKDVRVKYRSRSQGHVWSQWSEVIMSERLGDGIEVNNGIISVPEYDGATSSASGTAGLVPPATASQRGKSLLGDGSWGNPEYAVKSATADRAVCTPNIVSGKAGANLPSGGTWKVLHDSNGKLSSFNLSGGTRVYVSGGALQDFVAFRIA